MIYRDFSLNITVFPPENFSSHSSVKSNELESINQKVKHTSKRVFNFTRGAVKKVWGVGKKVNNIFVPEGKHVYYTAVFSFFNKNKKELQQEVKIMKTIERKVRINKGSTEHLAVGAKVIAKGIGKKYTVRVDRAKSDFEKKITSPTTTLGDRLRFGKHFLSGIRYLHEANFAYDDMKPENCLIYENKKGVEVLKISDFGKTKYLKDKKSMPYKGNTRFAPPEGKLSKKGDVYSAALVLIRNFEEEFLKDKTNTRSSLITPPKEQFDRAASKKLRGIEKYLVEHKASLASNPGKSLSGAKKRWKMDKLSRKEMKVQEQAVHTYINALVTKLSKTELGEEKAKKFGNLLRGMTSANSRKRPTSSNALRIYAEIFSD